MDPVTLAFALLFTAMTVVIVPVYYVQHGPANFLWFSDIALFGLTVALWLESPLIASTIAVAVLLPEAVWVASFVSGLLFGRTLSTLAGYMFDPGIPRYLRALSLFHLALPPAILWMLYRYGYDERALTVQTLVAWVVLPATYFLAPPEKNVNWVRGFGHPPKSVVPPHWHVLLMMAAYPLVVYLPTHWLLRALAPEAGAEAH
ncbi:MAG TPA: membrane-associated protein [Gammaproteobacteria bacterium]